MNNDKKATWAGIIAGVGQLLPLILGGIGISVPMDVTNGITAIALFVLGFFTNRQDK